MTSSEHHQMITEDGRKRLLEIRQKLYSACRELPQLARQELAPLRASHASLREGLTHHTTPRLGRLADASKLARQEFPQLARRELAQLNSTRRELPQLARRLLQQLARQERRHQHQKEWLQDTNNKDDRTCHTDDQ